MKVFELAIGTTRRYVAAENEAAAQRSGENAELNPDICYLPFSVTEVTVPGYEITVYPEGTALNALSGSNIPEDREELKDWLTERGIEFTANWGDKRLRELAEVWEPPVVPAPAPESDE